MMPSSTLKPGQKVKVTTRSGEVQPGVFVTEHTGTKGSYLEVDHGDKRKPKKYRAANVAAA